MNYLQKAKNYASMWSIDAKGKHEFTFDEIGLEYFLDSLEIDFLATKDRVKDNEILHKLPI